MDGEEKYQRMRAGLNNEADNLSSFRDKNFDKELLDDQS